MTKLNKVLLATGVALGILTGALLFNPVQASFTPACNVTPPCDLQAFYPGVKAGVFFN